MRTRPSAVSSIDATDARWTSPEPVNPAPCQASASPMPEASARLVRTEHRTRDRAGPGARVTGVRGPVAQTDEFGCLGRTLEDLFASDAVLQDLAGRCRVALAVDVPPPDIEWRDRQSLGDPVEMRLGGELGLRGAEPAERPVRWRVGAGRPGPDADIRAAVRAARVDGAARQDDRGERAIRTAVHDDLDVLGDQCPVAGGACPVADDRRVALGRRRDVLVAVVDHPDRLLRLSRQQGRMESDDRRELLLAAEPATGLRLDDPCGVVLEPEPLLERGVDVVGALERAGDGDAAPVGRDSDHRVVLDVELLLVADPVLALEDQIGGRERGIRIAALDGIRREHVLGCVGVEHRGQLGRPGPGPATRLAERRLVGRRDQGERLGVVEDLATDRHEDRLVVLDRADDVLAGDVVGGDDDDLRPIEGRIELEGLVGRVRVARADGRAVPGAGDDDVVRVQRSARELRGALAAQRHGGAGAARDRRAGWDDERVWDGRPGRHARDDTIAAGPSDPLTHQTAFDLTGPPQDRCRAAPGIPAAVRRRRSNGCWRPYHPGPPETVARLEPCVAQQGGHPGMNVSVSMLFAFVVGTMAAGIVVAMVWPVLGRARRERQFAMVDVMLASSYVGTSGAAASSGAEDPR